MQLTDNIQIKIPCSCHVTCIDRISYICLILFQHSYMVTYLDFIYIYGKMTIVLFLFLLLLRQIIICQK